MAEPRNRLHLTAELPAPREQVFDFLTDRFGELWQGRPPWRGPLVAAAMKAGWALRGRRRLAKRFPGPGRGPGRE